MRGVDTITLSCFVHPRHVTSLVGVRGRNGTSWGEGVVVVAGSGCGNVLLETDVIMMILLL